jgi:hypothetical protein
MHAGTPACLPAGALIRGAMVLLLRRTELRLRAWSCHQGGRVLVRCPPVKGPTYTPGVDYLVALIPSLGTGLLFYFVIRAFVNADRNEREALRKLDEEALRKDSQQAHGA